MTEKETFGKVFENGSFGDLHVHTNYSESGLACDGTAPPERLVDLAEEYGHSFIAITDHDTIASSVRGKEHALKQGYNVEVIVGAEISTTQGHILALNLQENIPFWSDPTETVRKIHSQGGLAISAHPFYSLTSSLGEQGLKQVAFDQDPDVYWDGMEVFNAGANDFRLYEWVRHFTDGNRVARRFYTSRESENLYGAAVGGSDTHTSRIGRAVTSIPPEMDIYTAIKAHKTGVVITDLKEAYSPTVILEIDRKSKELEKSRHQVSADLRVFPNPWPRLAV
jgi:predicted metal-dependent phosphoesterase TrpH